MAKRTILGIGASTYHLCWSLRSCPPPKWGADDVVELVPVQVKVGGLLPRVVALLQIGEHALVTLMRERGMGTWA